MKLFSLAFGLALCLCGLGKAMGACQGAGAANCAVTEALITQCNEIYQP